MHPELLAALTDPDLGDGPKKVMAYVYAHTNGMLQAVLGLDAALADLRITAGVLRKYRAELFSAGYLRSRVRGNDLECELEARYERAPDARSYRENAHLVRADEDASRAPGARDEVVEAAKRAPGARFEGDARAPGARDAERAERENLARARIGIVKYDDERRGSPRSIVGGAGGDDGRTAELLGAVGLSPAQVRELTGQLSFEDVVRHVAAWQGANTSGRKYGVGALLNRLREWPVPETGSAAELQAGVLEKFVSDEDLDDWGVKRPLRMDEGYSVPKGFEGLVMH